MPVSAEALKPAFATRRELLSPLELDMQKGAIRNLVEKAHAQLMQHKVDRDVSEDTPEGIHRFDSFYYIPSISGVMLISSLGLPDAPDTGGLFVYIDYKDEEGNIQTLVSLQTAKIPDAVGNDEAYWLSRFNPHQLALIAQLVSEGNSIPKEAFSNWLKEPPVRPRVEM